MSCLRSTAVVIALIGVSAAVQCVAIRRAVVPAQDAVRYAAAAQAYAQDGFRQTLAAEPEPPLFPLWACVTHKATDAANGWLHTGDVRGVAWATKLQWAAAVPLVLCVVPVYFATLRWLGFRAALAAGLLFAVLQAPARLGADGISDSTHLLLVAVAIWATSKCLTPGRAHPAWLVATGAAIGLALLVRAEAWLLVPALAIVLFWVARAESAGRPARQFAIHAGCLLFGLAVVLVPYVCVSSGDGARVTALRLVGQWPPRDGLILNASGARPSAMTLTGVPTLADGAPMKFARHETAISSRFHGIPAAAVEFARELSGVFDHWLLGFVVLGAWRAGRWRRPMDRFALLLLALFALAAIAYAGRVGYLSCRHVLVLVLIGLPWAGRGVVEAGRLASILPRRMLGRRRVVVTRGMRRFVFPTLLAMTAVGCLMRTTRPLHASRSAHRQAAQWLAAEGRSDGAALDSRGWTGLYSTRRTYLCDAGWEAAVDAHLRYVVVESWEVEMPTRRGRTLRQLLAAGARHVARFADETGATTTTVDLYEVDPPLLAGRWASTTNGRE